MELAAHALGLPLDDPARPLTCTGGLTFFGGPGNDYATHGIIAVARRLRAAREPALGLATALGWYATKHALGLAETCTLVYDRDGVPSYGILFALLDDGRRVVMKTDDPSVMARLPAEGFLGSRVRIGADGSVRPA